MSIGVGEPHGPSGAIIIVSRALPSLPTAPSAIPSPMLALQAVSEIRSSPTRIATSLSVRPHSYRREMGIEATGKLHTIFETKQVSERFSKREFVVELADNPKYPQTVLFQLTGDRCAQLDGMAVGDQV